MAGHDQAPGGGPALGRDHGGAGRLLSRVVRVVPDVPSFAVDDGFSYSVPDGIEAPLGSLVRVPLGGRRVRGWVVAEMSGDGTGLKDVLARSGDLAVFDRKALETMRWAAARYVAPLSSVLGKATPPNIPKARRLGEPAPLEVGTPTGPAAAILTGRRPATEVWVGPGPWGAAIAAAAAPLLAAGRGVLVVAPTVEEGEALAAELAAAFGDRVVFAASAASGAEQTAAWVQAARRPGSVLVGTRQVALWPVRDLSLAFVVGEGRRGMKDKATPTMHAREVLVRRSQVERIGLVMCGLVPSAEALVRGTARRVPPAVRPWGHVEVVDRRLEESSGGLLGETARAALRAAVTAGTRVLLFTHRRATSQRCVGCRTVRRCATCGSGLFSEAECVRCGGRSDACPACGLHRFEMLGAGVGRVRSEAARVVGRHAVGDPGGDALVVVGTERDLPGLSVGLTVVVDGDGPLLAPTYRAAEDALRLFARAIAAAGTGRGRRGLIQTSDPGHGVFAALRSGDPVEFIRGDAALRSAAGFPPAGEVLVIEVEDPPDGATVALQAALAGRGEVLGPADAGGRSRWLIQGTALGPARIALRSLVAQWREGGARVRVDADPVDL